MSASEHGRRLVVGNWKMHGNLAANAGLLRDLKAGMARLAGAGQGLEMVVCVPFPYLAQVREALRDSAVAWGAQDVSAHAQGAYTGEVSATMLADFDCGWVLCGHSERRAQHAETDADVAAKAAAALAAGLRPIVCVGETLDERQQGRLEAVVAAQLQPLLGLGSAAVGRMVFAYEPVWAIGTGHAATPEQAQAAHAFIRSQLASGGTGQVRLLYGGSVGAANAAALFAQPDIDGVLVGGASLRAQEFLEIAAA